MSLHQTMELILWRLRHIKRPLMSLPPCVSLNTLPENFMFWLIFLSHIHTKLSNYIKSSLFSSYFQQMFLPFPRFAFSLCVFKFRFLFFCIFLKYLFSLFVFNSVVITIILTQLIIISWPPVLIAFVWYRNTQFIR